MNTEETQLARIAIPASFYIAVPMKDGDPDEALIAKAKARIQEVLNDYAIEAEDFAFEDHACVYINHEEKASVEDRNW